MWSIFILTFKYCDLKPHLPVWRLFQKESIIVVVKEEYSKGLK